MPARTETRAGSPDTSSSDSRTAPRCGFARLSTRLVRSANTRPSGSSTISSRSSRSARKSSVRRWVRTFHDHGVNGRPSMCSSIATQSGVTTRSSTPGSSPSKSPATNARGVREGFELVGAAADTHVAVDEREQRFLRRLGREVIPLADDRPALIPLGVLGGTPRRRFDHQPAASVSRLLAQQLYEVCGSATEVQNAGGRAVGLLAHGEQCGAGGQPRDHAVIRSFETRDGAKLIAADQHFVRANSPRRGQALHQEGD